MLLQGKPSVQAVNRKRRQEDNKSGVQALVVSHSSTTEEATRASTMETHRLACKTEPGWPRNFKRGRAQIFEPSQRNRPAYQHHNRDDAAHNDPICRFENVTMMQQSVLIAVKRMRTGVQGIIRLQALLALLCSPLFGQ
jgi:hypothetical protein